MLSSASCILGQTSLGFLVETISRSSFSCLGHVFVFLFLVVVGCLSLSPHRLVFSSLAVLC